MAAYRAAARKRWARERQALAERRQRAWELVRNAAALLRREFGASQVVVFGSLVHADLFHDRSDVDLAVRGLDERVYLRAAARLLGLDPAIEVDLIRVEEAARTLQGTIEREGVPV
jgi:predicted nucleotidyltransferase